MKRLQIILCLIIGGAILFLLPFFFDKDTNTNIATGVNLLSGFCSLLTLIIALLLFNKYGIEKTLIEKQTQEVFQLLENLTNTTLVINSNDLFMRFCPAKPYDKFYENYYDRQVLFSLSYFEGLNSVIGFGNKVFLPKEIGEKLRAMQIVAITHKINEPNENALKVTPEAVYTKNNTDRYGLGNDTAITFKEYIEQWISLIDLITDWIGKNSSIKSELNLR